MKKDRKDKPAEELEILPEGASLPPRVSVRESGQRGGTFYSYEATIVQDGKTIHISHKKAHHNLGCRRPFGCAVIAGLALAGAAIYFLGSDDNDETAPEPATGLTVESGPPGP